MSRQSRWQPHRPKYLSTYAEFCLEALADRGLGAKISVGGAIGLLHYWDYRPTHRDFRDIHALCQAGLTDPAEAWQWWRERQQLAGSDTDGHRARLAVETHLARIAQHRPLAEIADPAERASAEQVRHWFVGEFLDALLD